MWAFHYKPLWSETHAVSVADGDEERRQCRGLEQEVSRNCENLFYHSGDKNLFLCVFEVSLRH